MAIFIIFAVICLSIVYLAIHSSRQQKAQLAYLNNYQFHSAIKEKLKNKHPLLTDKQLEYVLDGLRDFFYLCQQSGSTMVAMPSQVVDDAWHEFILFTQSYELFCENALGRFLHHTPAEAMQSPTSAQAGIKRAWRLACSKEAIEPQKPKRLPRIFAIDAQLAIVGGFIYSLDCHALTASIGEFCVSHIGCGGCGGGDGGGNGGESGDGGGCGSGCGGGCGGGG